jgi:hypothetical protein
MCDPLAKIITLSLAAWCFCVWASADTVTLTNGLELNGKIQQETDEHVVLRLDNDGGRQVGRLVIPLSKIKRDENGRLMIEYDISTQLEKLDDEDWPGHYKLGVWAFEKGLFTDAVRQFEKVKGKPDVGPDLLKLLGKAYEQLNPPLLENALVEYGAYLLLHPEDAEVLAAVEELKKNVKPAASPDAEKTKPVEGLEGDGNWFAEKWSNADPCTLKIITDPETGNRMIAVQTTGTGTQDKFAFTRIGAPLNLENSAKLSLRVFHDGSAKTRMAAAFCNATWEFFESKQRPIPANAWTDVVFPLDNKDFKSEKTEWKHSTDIVGKDKITRITLMIYGDRPKTMYVDSVGFVGREDAKK